jgi:hypothetical protein
MKDRVATEDSISNEAEVTTEAGDVLQLLHEQLGGFMYCERS